MKPGNYDLTKLSERFRWVAQVSGLVENGSAWAKAAGMPPQYTSGIIHQTKNPGLEVIEKYAIAAGISVQWLRHGTGDPVMGELQRDNNKTAIIAWARTNGETAAVLQMLEDTSFQDEQPMSVWVERLLLYRETDEHLSQPPSQPPDDE